MPAYNFKERFCPYVIDGSKPHTIRNFRKQQVFPGQTLFLYKGLRTRKALLMRKERCDKVRTIGISPSGHLIIAHTVRPDEMLLPKIKRHLRRLEMGLDKSIVTTIYEVSVYSLSQTGKDRLAWYDGFRPEGSTVEAPTGAFEMMLACLKSMYSLPFIGNIIYWEKTSA